MNTHTEEQTGTDYLHAGYGIKSWLLTLDQILSQDNAA